MSTFLRSILVIAALLGGTSSAFATTQGYGSGKGWVSGKGGYSKPLSTRAFFDQQRKNSN